jgi:DNA modification methylase
MIALKEENLIIHIGNALDELRKMPENSIKCCITSPPYWGLRDYGIEKTIWDGDFQCIHEWATEGKRHRGGKNKIDYFVNQRLSEKRNNFTDIKTGSFCIKCGAWFGVYGLEPNIDLYVKHSVDIFREVRRVLKINGTLWLNLGDTYFGSWGNYGGQNRGNGKQREINGVSIAHRAYEGLENMRPPMTNKIDGLKPKDLCGIPWRVALALQADGWFLRSDIIWNKPNPMPESIKDRPTKSHEYIFLMSKSDSYYYDFEAIKENAKIDSHKKAAKRGEFNGKTESLEGRNSFRALEEKRNKRTVWTVPVFPFQDMHFATFPPDLIKPCISAGTKPDDYIIDPFIGSGTTAFAALELNRKCIGIDLNPENIELIKNRTIQKVLKLY